MLRFKFTYVYSFVKRINFILYFHNFHNFLSIFVHYILYSFFIQYIIIRFVLDTLYSEKEQKGCIK